MAMLSAAELADHLWALALVTLAALLPGITLTRCLPARLRARDAVFAWPLLGLAYWSLSLYLFPFRGGLWLAAALAVAGAAAARFRARHPLRARSRDASGAIVILALGTLPCVTPALSKHVPDGMDAARYAMNARLIASRAGLPDNLAPFAPTVSFGAANHGIPTLAAVAVVCGATPNAALLATIPFTFGALALGMFVLLRLATRRRTAAAIAVLTVWLAKSAQQTTEWGGFPGVAALALGLLALRLLVDVFRAHHSGVPALGLCVGALPLVHASTATAWLHVLAPLALVSGWWVSRQRARGAARVLFAAVIATGLLSVYYVAARPRLDPAAAWIRDNVLTATFDSAGFPLLAETAGYLASAIGRTTTLLLLAAAAWLAIQGRWRALLLAGAILGLTLALLLNAPAGWLPSSSLLYPERVRDLPLVAVGIVFAATWRASSSWRRSYPMLCRTGAALIISLAA